MFTRLKHSISIKVVLIFCCFYFWDVKSQTPPCGSIITTPGAVIQFNSDMVCPEGFTGVALTIAADGVIVDGLGQYKIIAPSAESCIKIVTASNVTIRGIDVSGTGAGFGINIVSSSGTVVTSCVATNRSLGLYIRGSNSSDNRIEGNNFSNCSVGIYNVPSQPAGERNLYIDNNVSNSTEGIIIYRDNNPTLSGNDYTNCTRGVTFHTVDGVSFGPRDFSSYNISGTVVSVAYSNNVTLTGINASGTGAGHGINIRSSSSTVITSCVATNRSIGLNIRGPNSSYNRIEGNDFSDCGHSIYNVDAQPVGDGNSYINNNFSNSTNGIMIYGDNNPTLSGNNYTNCTRGVTFHTVDGASFGPRNFSSYNISGPVVSIVTSNNVTLTGINASGKGSGFSMDAGFGISIYKSSGTVLTSCVARNRYWGLYIRGLDITGNRYEGNDFSDCYHGIYNEASHAQTSGDGNSYINNYLSNSKYGIIICADNNPTLSGNNYTNCINGVMVRDVDGANLGSLDFSSYNISNIALQLAYSNNVTLTGINASGAGPGTGIWINRCTGTLVTSCTAKNRSCGLTIEGPGSMNNRIEGNNFSDCGTGIYNYVSNPVGDGNSYINNNLSNSSDWGISIYGDNNPTISGNDFTGCTNGLYFREVDGVSFGPRDFSSYNISGTVLKIYKSNNVTFTDINASGTGTGKGFEISQSSVTEVTSCIATNRSIGLNIYGPNSTNNQIIGNDFSGCGTGINNWVYQPVGDGNSYIDNDLSNSSQWGIQIYGDNNPTLSGNDYTNCTNGLSFRDVNEFSFGPRDFSQYNISGTVLYILYSSNVTLTGINASGTHTGIGIRISRSAGTTVKSCILSNREHGLQITGSESSNNQIYENEFSGNDYGLYLPNNTMSNLIYHNNIINNTIQAHDTSPENNDWHHPVLLEGNYWSDYTGLDDGSGSDKHAIAGDGIGDTDIPWPAQGYDFYPFIHESSWFNMPPTAEAGPDAIVECISSCCTKVLLDGSDSSDPDDDLLSYTWMDDGNVIAGPTTDPVSLVELSFSEHMIELTVADGKGGNDSDNLIVNIVDTTPPEIIEIIAPVEPLQVGTEITATANFTDACGVPHTAFWNWGDNTPVTAGAITEPTETLPGKVTGTHIYDYQGVYVITLTLNDDSENSSESTFKFVVIFDPSSGSVTGGGWIDSPEGAYTPDENLSGRARFGFVSKYQKGANEPTGQTFFNFHIAGMRFRSSSYQWLVIAGSKAKYKGEGEINNSGEYGFMLSATDGQMDGGTDPDRFRIKIWEKATEDVIYDNQMGDEDDSDATDAIEGGNIQISTEGNNLNKRIPTDLIEAWAIPEEFGLFQNYPNPFNPETQIRYAVPEQVQVRMDIYNVAGKKVRTLMDGLMNAGYHSVTWNGRDGFGNAVSGGLYLCRIQAGTFEKVIRMVFMK